MLNPKEFAKELIKVAEFFAGVPDSVLKHLCTALEEIAPFHTSVNEGAAVALSAGYTIATGKLGAVYMQNSGIGNSINPLLSLNDALVYSIPTLLIIGWRGEPNVKDEPQHIKQGLVTEELLRACGIPYKILPSNFGEAVEMLNWAKATMESTSAPVALLVRNNLFEEIKVQRKNNYVYKREQAIEDILSCLSGDELVISTTGMISRELWDVRMKQKGDCADLLTVGSMGHVSQIAMGIALNRPEDKVVCLDGDGSVLMHMGSMVTVGQRKVGNMIHIVLNNSAHDSVGGHKTDAANVDWKALALACGYDCAWSVNNFDELENAMRDITNCTKGSCFLEIKIVQGARADVSRPAKTPVEIKQDFEKTMRR